MARTSASGPSTSHRKSGTPSSRNALTALGSVQTDDDRELSLRLAMRVPLVPLMSGPPYPWPSVLLRRSPAGSVDPLDDDPRWFTQALADDAAALLGWSLARPQQGG